MDVNQVVVALAVPAALRLEHMLAAVVEQADIQAGVVLEQEMEKLLVQLVAPAAAAVLDMQDVQVEQAEAV